MRIRALLFMSVAAMAVLGIGASAASAATLYTSAAHTTRVANGALATASSTGVRLTSGSATVNNCATSTLHLSLTSNAGPSVVGTVNTGSFGSCVNATTFTGSWTLNVTGSGTMVGGSTSWAATANGVSVDFLGGNYAGNVTTGLTATQGTTSGTGLCVVAAQAGTLVGPLTSVGKIDGTYCFTGTAANWSLG